MLGNNENSAEMLTAIQVREITGVPVSTLHDWAAKGNAALTRPDLIMCASAGAIDAGHDAT